MTNEYTGEEYVSLKTAKLLKQAGFDWECRAYYEPDVWEEELKFVKYGPSDNFNNPKFSRITPHYSAPTLAVVQRWLIEEKHLWVSVHIDPYFNLEDALYRAELYDEKLGFYCTTDWDDEEQKEEPREFCSYEDALEDGIQAHLRYLIENKQ